MNIHHNLEAIIEVAKHHAKEHNTNYNVILHNPINGEFGDGSTYEYVTDSYFNKERNCILLHKTDDLLENERLAIKEMEEDPFNTQPSFMLKNAFDVELHKRMVEASGGRLYRANTYVREQPKISRNEPCPCGSGKKYKKCCQ